MRTHLVIILVLCIFQSVKAQEAKMTLDQRYTIEVTPAPLIEVLGVIRAETGISFVYSPSNLPVNQLVAISAKESTLEGILDTVLTPLHIRYELIGGQVALRWSPSVKRAEYTQTIRGRVVDSDSQAPLVGAHVIVNTVDPVKGSTTDLDGYFEIPGIPIGRHIVTAQYIGFLPLRLPEQMLTAGKELVLNIELTASQVALGPIEIASSVDPLSPLNEIATVSARSFSVEHTQRYAASLFDPARMAQVFAGVTRGDDDLLNDVVVRGQSPKYTIWMLEGIEIPNPNHFGEEGYSSGGVNMLSAGMLTYSDFLTGAFPASYGNALAGVFDINLRKGNNVKPEHTIHMGVLGLEATTEGPFSKRYNGSYVFNYRYSTAGLLSRANLLQEDVLAYEDLAFKVYLPTRFAGQFDLFGVAGISRNENYGIRDTTLWQERDPLDVDLLGDDEVHERRAIAGVGHTFVFSPNAYMKTTVAGFFEQEKEFYYTLIPEADFERRSIDEEEIGEWGVRGKTSLQWKKSSQNVFHAGIGASHIIVNYLFRDKAELRDSTWVYDPSNDWNTILDTRAPAFLWNGYLQWMHRPHPRFQLHAGVHISGFNVNRETTIEPRLGVRWQLQDDLQISFGSGLHSQIEPYATYLVEQFDGSKRTQPNRSLRKSKSWHSVIGLEHRFSPVSSWKAEMYYNLGYDMPVGTRPGSSFSIVNSYYLYDILVRREGLSNKGKTANYGIDVTYERTFSDGFYTLFTGSLFDSKYSTLEGFRYSTRYDTGYMANVLGGIERRLNKRKNNLVSLNGRIVFGGGNKYTPIDIKASQQAGFEVNTSTDRFAAQLEPYFRVDFGFNFTFNMPYVTHTFYFDGQNILNQKNLGDPFYHPIEKRVLVTRQTGILPIFGYKLTF